MTEQEMLKEALEWQEYIRELITATDYELYHKRSKVFDWLLEQAEKVEQLQQENERLKKFLNWEQEEAQGLDEEVTFQLEQLKQAQAKIERYEKALEFYADEEHYKDKQISEVLCDADGVYISNDEYLPSIIYLDKGETARKALESDEN